MRTDSSPHWHRSAGEGVGLLGRQSPGPTAHPQPDQVQLKRVRCQSLCELSGLGEEDKRLQEDDSTYPLSR